MASRCSGVMAGLLLCGLMLASPEVAAGQGRRAPNVVIFFADDLGAHDLGCTGSTFYQTPNLDRLAEQGARFTQAYAACPVCSPSRASLMTGKWPARTGVTNYLGAPQADVWNRNTLLLPAPYRPQLELSEVTLAEILRDRGYATMHAGKWHLGPEGFWPEDQGYQVNKGGHSAGAPGQGGKYFVPYKNPRLEDGLPGEHLSDRLARECSDFIRANKDRPFLVSYCLYDVHTPLMGKPELVEKYEALRKERGLEPRYGREGLRDVREIQEHAVYAAMVETMDASVGAVLKTLHEQGLDDNTLVIFSSDNGGLSTSEGWPTSNLPLRAGKGWLYEGGIRVPLILRWPGVTRPGSLIDSPAITTDLFATAVAATGEAVPSDGRNLAPVLKGEPDAERPLFWHYPHYGNQGAAPGSAMRLGRYKLIVWEEGGVELFDLQDDRSEKNPLTDPERTSSMLEQLLLWKEQVGAKSPTRNPGYNPDRPNGRGSNNNPSERKKV